MAGLGIFEGDSATMLDDGDESASNVQQIVEADGIKQHRRPSTAIVTTSPHAVQAIFDACPGPLYALIHPARQPFASFAVW